MVAERSTGGVVVRVEEDGDGDSPIATGMHAIQTAIEPIS